MLTTIFGAACARSSTGATSAAALPLPARDLMPATNASDTATAVFAGGCFWCVEAVFEQLAGVVSVVSGYAGGDAATAQYDTVSAGGTGHAESVQVTYRPAQISYGKLLQVFFSTTDPTQREGQGPDHGHQYRSAIFYTNDAQKTVVAAYLQQLTQAKVFDKPIVTSLERLDRFFAAEDYHQDFVLQHPTHPYVKAWSLPKLDKLHHLYPDLLKPKP